ncbi:MULTISPECIES: hypothetical protein [Staphylococcus]|uniref:5,10-methylene-tetrahydrofolate dehydrogenase n=3 Tax=Staphylococcus cohnii species complex TaxID=3239053 RepID=A0AB34AIA3_STAUR|nr:MULTISPECIES: hypothetical protein [Staphylococcus]TGP61869.1 hypothetical protein EN872_07955 [bacterium M00.F.Ca.ET.229.01.1.1]TGS38420.1 hypothetical protein EN823_07950 [bacterium M00.F.Ca.ET.180.01.1.1]AYX90697.1 hypothetical protein EGX68_10840 [Staphylococcus cohnii]KKI65506.1 hypothetical protein UF66_1463 [Staphylococcus cohnii subsp. cohnii]MBL0376275.1 hypothetical protein [Staphylococcus sp. S75]
MNLSIGLIPSPDMPHKLINKIYSELPKDFTKHVDNGVEWQFEIHVASMIGTAEHMDKVLDIASNMKQQKNWDYTICITDLPNFSKNKSALCDIDFDTKTALLSLPALGNFKLKEKLRQCLIFIIEYLHSSGRNKNTLNFKHFKLTQFKEVIPKDNNENYRSRIIAKSTFLGWLHLICGMTFANEPWSAIFDFKKIISVSFATGTYIAIFSTPWDISLDYSYWRYILLMLLSVLGMVGWLIYSYKLWERPSANTQKLYRFIYNITTFTTLLTITFLNFIVLYILLSLSTILFVPPELFSNWTSLNSEHPTILNYINLIWFITSLGILAGAMGSTVENAEKIKRVTYSFRQYYRSKSLEQEDEDSSSAYAKADYYKGEKQSHHEEGLNEHNNG